MSAGPTQIKTNAMTVFLCTSLTIRIPMLTHFQPLLAQSDNPPPIPQTKTIIITGRYTRHNLPAGGNILPYYTYNCWFKESDIKNSNLLQHGTYFLIIVQLWCQVKILSSLFPLTKHCTCHATGFVSFSRIWIDLQQRLQETVNPTLRKITRQRFQLSAKPFRGI